MDTTPCVLHLLDLADDAVSVRTFDDRIVYWNKGAERLYGWTVDEARGQRSRELLETQFPKPLAEIEEYFLKHGHWHGELLQKKRDGQPLTVASRWTLEHDRSGRPQHILEIGSDISRRLELEEHFYHSQKMESVARLAGGLAHDFANFLRVIAGRTDRITAALAPEDRLREDLDVIRKTTDRAATLTRQLLAFGRRQPVRPQLIDLNTLLVNMDRLLRRLIGDEVQVIAKLADEAGVVRADPGLLEQVVVNLIINAREAMPSGGSLTIETGRVDLDMKYVARHASLVPGVYAMLAVSDTGCGMDEEVQSRMFEPFFSTKHWGTGLGLSTAYSIVKQFGGSIWVSSEVRVGTTVKVYLPIAVQAPAPSPVAFDLSQLGGGETVLLVEHDEGLREALGETLRTHGYTVIEAANSAEALRLAEAHSTAIGLLVADAVELPAEDVAPTVSRLHSGLKTLYMSGYAGTAEISRRIFEPGCNFIRKPFTQLEFISKVQEILAGPRQ